MSQSTGKFLQNRKRLPPEDINIDTWYTFSINFDQKIIKSGKSPFDQLSTQKQYIESILTHKCKTIYALFPELSANGKLHWHGVIMWQTLPAICNFYFEQLPSLLKGTNEYNLEIDTIGNMKEWRKYITKGAYMREYLKMINQLDRFYPIANCKVTLDTDSPESTSSDT